MPYLYLSRRGAWSLSILSALLFLFVSTVWADDVQHLLNVNFGGGTKIGALLVGNGTNDLWNIVTGSSNTTSNNLVWATGSNSTVSVTITNLSFNDTVYDQPDAALGSYLGGVAYDFCLSESIPASLVVSNLPVGTYDIYLVSFGGYPESEHDTFTLTVGTNSYGPLYTLNNSFDVTSTNLTLGDQYVAFTNIVVSNSEPLYFSMIGAEGHALNAMQIIDPSSTNVTPTLPEVTFDPVDGTGTPVDVTLYVTNHSDATIYYTLDGNTPTTNSTVYSSPISIEVQTTIKAFATKSGYNDSPVATATYPLSRLPLVTFNPTDGAGLPTNVVLTVAGHTNVTIYYTTNGVDPTTNSPVYTEAIALNTNGWSYSANQVPTMTDYDVPSGSVVTSSSELSGTNTMAWKAFDHTLSGFWTADGTGPEWVALQFPSARRIAKYALYATDAGDAPKDWTLEGWNGSGYVVIDTRSAETNWSAYEQREYVCTNSAMYTKYRLNISAGNTTSFNPGAYIMVGEVEMYEASITIAAFATETNWLDSYVAYANYHARPEDQLQIAPTPFFSPAGGTFNNDAGVTISSALSGASYEYSTNGTDWVSYTGAITLDRPTSLLGRTLKSGFATSDVRTNDFAFVVATPVISPNGGLFTNSVEVTLSTTTTGATLEYQIGGGSWQTYSSPFSITNTATLTVAGSRTYFTSSTNTATFTAVDVNTPPGQLLNVNFGSGTKTGYAAVGNSTNDVWNTIAASSLSTNSSLLWVNGSNAPVSVVVKDLGNSYGTGHSDPMLATYIYGYGYEGAEPQVQVSGLSSNVYDFYFLALSSSYDYESAYFAVTVNGNTTYSSYTTTTSEESEAYGPIKEGLHFVAVRNVVVDDGQTVIIHPYGSSDTSFISGLQIMVRGPVALTLPNPTISPAGGTFTEPVSLTIANPWVGATNRYSLDNGSTWMTNDTVTLDETGTIIAQSFRSGYSDSGYTTNSYTINLPTAVSPSVTPEGAEFAEAKTITLYSALAGASYRYSVDDGATWVTNDTVRLTTNATLLAQTVKFGYVPSATVTNNYTINTNLTVVHGGVLNLNFGSGTKTGLAATGLTTNDYWNVVGASTSAASLTNPITSLVWSDTNVAGVTMVMTNLASEQQTYHPDAMLDRYLSGPSTDFEYDYPAFVKVRNLPSGTYDFYFYMMGADTEYGDDHTGAELITSTSTNATKWANQNHDYIDTSTALTEGLQYVVFTNVTVEAGTTVTFQLHSDAYSYALNGIQIRNPNVTLSLPSVEFSPSSGTVPVDVTLSVPGHSGATIYYTLDGSTPTTNSTVYSSTLSITNALTVKALATESGYEDSTVSAASYTLPQLPSVSFDPGSGATVPTNVVLSVTGHGDAVIYYTLDGNDPTTNSAVYSTAISVTNAVTIKAFATKDLYLDSAITSASYILPTAPAPDASPVGGTFTNDVSVTLSSSLAGADYEYSTNGTDWVSYTGAITLDRLTELWARTVKSGYVTSAVTTNSYVFAVDLPLISPNGGTFTNSVEVTLTTATTGATLEYQIGGGSWQTYSSPFEITNTALLTVVGSKTNYTSVTNTASFTAYDTNGPVNYGLLNINFGSGTKTGPEVVGIDTNDVWNLITGSTSNTVSGLVWANGSNSLATVTIINLPSTNATSMSSDVMLDTYVSGPAYDEFSSPYPVSVTVSNLPVGTYDFYVYSFQYPENGAETFQITAGTQTTGSKTVPDTYYDPYNDPLTEGYQYVVFTNLVVSNTVVTIDLSTYADNHLLSGLQIVAPFYTNAALPAVVFSPSSGSVPVDVTLTVPGHNGTTIYYTLDGSDPTTNSTVYSSTLSITNALTVKAFAAKNGYDNSEISSATYTWPQLPSVGFDPGSGATVPTNVVLSVTGHGDAVIYYTLDGNDPTTNSAVYSTAISVTNAVTIKAFATKTNYLDSAITSASYILPTAPAPDVTPAAGSYWGPLEVTVSNSLAGADVYVTTNGNDWAVYTNTLVFFGDATLLAKTVKAGYNDSATVTNLYVVTPSPVPSTSFSPDGGLYTNAVEVTLSNSLSGVAIEYSLDQGSNWVSYTAPFSLDGIGDGTGIVMARTSKAGYVTTTNASQVFVFAASLPEFSHASGAYTNAIELTLTNSTSGASNFYSLDGTTWQLYSGGISLSNNTTVYARTVKAGYVSNGHISHRAATSFSAIQGLDNWYYLYSTNSGALPETFLPLYDTTNAVWRLNTDTNCLVGWLYQSPGETNDAIRSFKSPYDGSVTISGTAYLDDVNNTNDVSIRILKNQTTLLDWTQIGASTSAVISVQTTLATDDELHFQASTNSSGATLTVNWDQVVQFENSRTYTFTDSDGDGLSDLEEAALGTDPNDVDSDGDGVSDYLEVKLGRNPLVSGTVADTGNAINLKTYTPLEDLE